MKDLISRRLTNSTAVQMAESICRRRGIEVSRTLILSIVTARNPETGRLRYFWSKDVIWPRGNKGFVLFDKGDFEERFIAAMKHYDANKPLIIRGKQITEDDLLDPGFDWSRLDEEDDGSTG